MTKYQLHVAKPSVNGTTGHHTVECHIIEHPDDGGGPVHGIMEKYGIDSLALTSLYGGDVNKWLQSVGQEMLVKHQRRQQINTDLANLANKTIDL